VTTVALDRRFYEWCEDADGLAHSRYRAAAGLSDGMPSLVDAQWSWHSAIEGDDLGQIKAAMHHRS
jgi:hypothetical protein